MICFIKVIGLCPLVSDEHRLARLLIGDGEHEHIVLHVRLDSVVRKPLDLHIPLGGTRLRNADVGGHGVRKEVSRISDKSKNQYDEEVFTHDDPPVSSAKHT